MAKVFERILIATDGSDNNMPAVKKGLELARGSGADLFVVFVVDETSFLASQMDVLPDYVYTTLRNEGEKAVEHIKEMAGDLTIQTVVLSGQPAQAITEFATKNKIDLIVVGSHGKTGIEKLLLGSVAEKILRLADCMVLVVKK